MPWLPVREVIPCAEVDDARQIARQFPPRSGRAGRRTRGGLAVEGFDLGNSPEDYTADRLRGKTLVITTTNGTRAMAHAQMASQIFLGAFVNVSASASNSKDTRRSTFSARAPTANSATTTVSWPEC